MERKVGEIFEYNGEWYQCIHTKSLGCEDCNEIVDITEEEETNESNKDIC